VAGLTGNGLSIKRLQEIRDDISANLKNAFGDDINTTEDSVFGQVRDSVAPGESSIWEQLQIVYDSQSPSRAEGQQLDDNAAIVGVFRVSNTNSTVRAAVTGDNNVLIPVGFSLAVNTTKDEFEIVSQKSISSSKTTKTIISVDVIQDTTDYTVTIDGVPATYTSDASATEAEIVAGLISAIPAAEPSVTAVSTSESSEVLISCIDPLIEKDLTVTANISILKVTSLIPMQAKEFGAIPCPLDQLTVIKTFITGIDSATNGEVATLGTLIETDAELRFRRETELSKTGSTSLEAIADRIDLVDSVVSTVILENYTDSVDGNGLAAHSFQAIVQGGEDQDIAEAIFNSKPVGIAMNGAESVAVEDRFGFSRNILFSRPTNIPIYIEITLTKFSDYPSDGDTQIKDALEAFGLDNLMAGDDVITSRLYTPINGIQGHQVDSLFIGTSPSPATSTPISITITELATISLVNITVV
tara:strand:- start:5925 stop:7340 length:1416 start_codon:yes stop_codon:yes gene_type:complete